jgi:hypothetical protein
MTSVIAPERRPTPRGITRSKRRVSPRVDKLLLTTHVIVAVGWLGLVFGKLVLTVAAVTAGTLDVTADLYTAMTVINIGFPPLAILTLVTGVLLSLGTKWGLLRHYWVATKLVLTIAVIVTAVQLGDRLVQESLAGVAGAEATTLAPLPTAMLLSLGVAHLLMLASRPSSPSKPWGKTVSISRWLVRRP